jgi:hypothetical protein
MAAVPVLAPGAAAAAVGQPWNEATLDKCIAALAVDMPLPPNAPGGQIEYRSALTVSFLRKFFIETSARFVGGAPAAAFASAEALGPHLTAAGLDPALASAVVDAERPAASGVNDLGDFDERREAIDAGHVNTPVTHLAAALQASGRAEYTDDTRLPPDTLHLHPFLSTVAHGVLHGIDASLALAMPGVVDVITAAEIMGSNVLGAIFKDETILPEFCPRDSGKSVPTIKHHSQILAVVVAKCPQIAKRAAAKLVADVTEVPAVINIEQGLRGCSDFHVPYSGAGEPDAKEKEGDERYGGRARIWGAT